MCTSGLMRRLSPPSSGVRLSLLRTKVRHIPCIVATTFHAIIEFATLIQIPIATDVLKNRSRIQGQDPRTEILDLHDIFHECKHATILHHHNIGSRQSLEALIQNTILFSLAYMPKHMAEFFLN